MSFWCGVLFAVTTVFSLNVLYHDLFVTEPKDPTVPKGFLLDSLHPPAGNWVAPKDPKSLDFISSPEFKIHQPFTALLPAKQAIEIQFEKELPKLIHTNCSHLSGVGKIPPMLFWHSSIPQITACWSNSAVLAASVEREAVNVSKIIIKDELPGEALQTCPAKDAALVKTEVKGKVENPVSEVISLGEQNDTSVEEGNITTMEEEIHKEQPAQESVQYHLQNHLEHDVFLLLGVHLVLVISVLAMGCRCLCAHKHHVNDTVDTEELVVTVGLISCIVVALFALLGATIILFIRILLAKFP
ncbi:uncharacterized protein LOC109921460 isoform X2 [Rhincodon typus]|uniref:uncharacterized protein LOC109921460 isoform X2 n=1 Tax=Rhincodon typus TaxID=259920 RepID=UPI00202F3954|nr:uncharacterized protein LOC109921460 isoform X2 [Rhincodon typus]